MFVDCLEVEEYLKMSKKLSNQDNGGEMKGKSELVGPPNPRGTVPVHPKPSFTKYRDDQPYDVKEDGSANLFSEYCNEPSTNYFNGDLKGNFDMPIYDEYEDDCLDVIPKELALNTRSNSEESQVVTRSQKAE